MSTAQKLLILFIGLESLAAAKRFMLPGGATLPEVKLDMLARPIAEDILPYQRNVKADDADSWVDLAEVYRTFGFFPQAVYCYRQAHRLAPADPMYLYSWAVTHSRMGETAEARKLFLEAIARHEAQAQSSDRGEEAKQYDRSVARFSWLTIGKDYLREENPADAETALRKAIDLPEAKTTLCRLLTRLGRAEEAAPLLAQLLKSNPQSTDVYQLNARAAEALGKPREAVEFAERALRCGAGLPGSNHPATQISDNLRREFGSARAHARSLALSRRRQAEAALEASRRAVELFWTEHHARQNARLALALGHTQEALDVLQQSVQNIGPEALTLSLLGDAKAQAGDDKQARRDWLAAVAAVDYPILSLKDAGGLHDKLASSYERAGDLDSALRQRGLRHFRTAIEHWEHNALNEAAPEFESASRLAADNILVWFYLGETRRFLHDFDGARLAYTRCLELDPDFGRARVGLERLR